MKFERSTDQNCYGGSDGKVTIRQWDRLIVLLPSGDELAILPLVGGRLMLQAWKGAAFPVIEPSSDARAFVVRVEKLMSET